MDDPHREDRLYTVILIGFFCGIVALGLFGVPALLVVLIAVVVAAVAITLLHVLGDRRQVPAKYVPSVLESGVRRRRRGVHLRRHRHPQPPLRLR